MSGNRCPSVSTNHVNFLTLCADIVIFSVHHYIPGFQIVGVVGGCGEPLPLVVPLPLGNRPAPQWLQALEGAMRYSLSCELTNSLATLPEPLMGINADEGNRLGACNDTSRQQ